MMRLLLICSALLPLLAYATATGEARNRDGELLYVERHVVDGDRHEIEYRNVDGVLFATSQLDYSFGGTQPAYRQENLREGQTEGARWQQGDIVLFHTDGSDEQQKRVVAPPQPLVMSSGFDHFIRASWEPLQRGETLRFHFAVPMRLMLVELRVRRIDAEAPAGGLALRADPVSPLWRLVTKPIELFYDADRRLLRYRGISNLELGESSPWVEVTYHYDEPAGVAGRATADAATPGLTAPR